MGQARRKMRGETQVHSSLGHPLSIVRHAVVGHPRHHEFPKEGSKLKRHMFVSSSQFVGV